jgi:hypothetical protein
MRKLLLGIATAVIIAASPAFGKPDQGEDDAFIFSSKSVVSVLDHSQSLRLGERLTFAQLKRRLHSYKVEKSHDCEGECIHVIGKNGVYLELAVPGKPISAIFGYLGSRDILGHVIGMSLIKAIGSDKASCSDMVEGGAWCPSKLIKNMEYSVDDNACPDEDKFASNLDPGVPYRLRDCWKVGTMALNGE